MKIDKSMNVLIVGLGLLGGSYARALKKKGYTVNAITKDQSSVDYAVEHGIIDRGTTEIDGGMIGEADLVVFALYPHVFLEWIGANQHHLKSGAMITDVTGVKCSVVYKVQAMLRPDVEFISAHPMAGREVYGVENSDERIFEKANYIVVPTDKNTAGAIELCESLGWELGFARVTHLTPETHDDMIAFLSQLTHCIAVALMCSSDNEHLNEYTGDSFRDLTRIAKINENMWSELFMLNRTALLGEMDVFIEQITSFRRMLENGDVDGMCRMMRTSTERRKKFDIR